MGASTTIKVEPSQEKYWLQVSYVVDALGYAKTDKGGNVPPGTIGKARTSEKDGILTFNVVVPSDFPSSWLCSMGIYRPDSSLRAGAEESGDPELHILKLSLGQFPMNMKDHLAFLSTVENSIGLMDPLPEAGGEPRAFLGFGLCSAIVRGEDYVFRIPADISARPFAAFLGLDRTKIVRAAVLDEAGLPVCDSREIPVHSFLVPVSSVRKHFAAQAVEGQKTVAFTLPKPPADRATVTPSSSDTRVQPDS